MCDPSDLGVHTDAAGTIRGAPSVFLYDQVPAGIGFSQKLFEIHDELIRAHLGIGQRMRMQGRLSIVCWSGRRKWIWRQARNNCDFERIEMKK